MKVKTNQPLMLRRDKITRKIADFWDQLSDGWQMVWGPHIHHGYYENNQAINHQDAQEKLIEKLAELLAIAPNDKILDVGCGMGGSSLYLAKNYQANVTGITLSQKQVTIANQQAQEMHIKKVSFKVEDALALATLNDNSFDIIWSLESCEQFFDKKLFIQQAFRVLKPGGTMMLATWCSSAEEYTGKLAHKYRALCLAFDIPYMPTIECYQNLLSSEEFRVKKTLDWSAFVKQSWGIGRSLLSSYTFLQLIRIGGWRGFRFSRQIKMMEKAFQQNRVQYGVFLATKPVAPVQ